MAPGDRACGQNSTGGGSGPRLPSDIASADHLAGTQIGLGDQHIDGRERRRRRRHPWAPQAAGCRPREQAATPPAASATPRTMRRAGFMTLQLPKNDANGGIGRWLEISPAKRQGMVNEAYPNRVNYALRQGFWPSKPLRSGRRRIGLSSIPLTSRSRHPLGLRIDQERRRRERDPVRNAGPPRCSRSAHARPTKSVRQRHGAELDDHERERPADSDA